jgi:hypothetical protein
MSRKMVLDDDSDEEPSKDSLEKSEESDDMDDDKEEAGHAVVADEDDDDDADEDAEPAAAAAAAAPAATQQPAAPKVKKPRKPTKKALAAAAAAAAAAAGGGGLGTDIVSIVKGILSQGLAPELVATMAEQALKQPEMQAVIQRLDTAGGAAGTPAPAAGASAPGTAAKVKRTRKPTGPTNFNVIVSACLAAHKAANKEAPMTLVTRAWALLPAEQQQPILEQIQHAR